MITAADFVSWTAEGVLCKGRVLDRQVWASGVVMLRIKLAGGPRGGQDWFVPESECTVLTKKQAEHPPSSDR